MPNSTPLIPLAPTAIALAMLVLNLAAHFIDRWMDSHDRPRRRKRRRPAT